MSGFSEKLPAARIETGGDAQDLNTFLLGSAWEPGDARDEGKLTAYCGVARNDTP